jgi:hypothetical protein
VGRVNGVVGRLGLGHAGEQAGGCGQGEEGFAHEKTPDEKNENGMRRGVRLA